VDRLRVRVFLGAVPRDETRLTIVAVDLQCLLETGRPGKGQNVSRI
jgi:hypothetical protein